MPQPTLSIFVSSTWKDLQPERAAVFAALSELGSSIPIKSNGMEQFGSRHENTLQTSLDETADCHIYVGIIGGRYGSGITEEEYNKALELGMPCFIYFKNIDEEQAGRARLRAFKKRLKNRHTCATFAEPSELAAGVKERLSKWYKKYSGENELTPPGSAPYALETSPTDFVGREREIDRLINALKPAGRARIAGINGMSGVGKTALALAVAERLRDDYPDGRLFIKLGDRKSAPYALHITLINCITQLGGEINTLDSLENLAGTYRNLLAGKRVLIVLDDAVDETHVEPFKPPGGCALLITSQKKLVVRDTGINLIRLNYFEESESRALLTRIEPRIKLETASQIARLCGHLPLALRAAGSFLALTADCDPADYVKQLRSERSRLKALGKSGVAISVGASFNISYGRLEEETKRVFRQLAVFPGSFDAAAEQEICQDVFGSHLTMLVQRSLVSYDGGRYHLHDLMRIYAKQQLSAIESASVAQRHARYFLHIAQDIERLYGEKPAAVREGIKKFDVEWENLQTGRAWTEKGHVTEEARLLCIAYTEALKYPLYLRRHPKEQAKWLEAALAAGRQLALPSTVGRFLCNLCTIYSLTDPPRAAKFCGQALRIARKTNDLIAEANALGSMGNVYVSMGQPKKAIKYYKLSLPILIAEGDGRGILHVLNNLGVIHSDLGKFHDAISFYQQAVTVARRTADPRAEAIALTNLGAEYIELGDAMHAFKYYERAKKLAEKIDDRRSIASALNGLGNACSTQKQHRQALEFHQQALTISQELDDRSGVGIARGNLGNAHAELREIDQAIKSHEQALKIARKLGERANEIRCLGNLGHTYYLSDNFDRAINFHWRTLKLSREIDNPTHEARTQWNIAQCYSKKGELYAAESHAKVARTIFKRLRHPLAMAITEFLTELRQKKSCNYRNR